MMNNEYENAYYHGLARHIIVNNPQLKIKTSLEQLEMILKSGGICSRNRMNELGINYLKHDGIFNEEDYISICVKEFPKEEYLGKNE